MDLPIVWFVAAALVFLAWATSSIWLPASASAKKSSSKEPRKSERKPARKPTSEPAEANDDLDPLPKFRAAEEDDDDVEITVVIASPKTERPPSQQKIPIDEEAPVSESSEASKIEVIYEDEADVEEVTSPVARILMSAVGLSDGGKVRRRNEDSLLVLPDRSVYAVADGMGGYAGGDIASQLAVETMRRAFEKNIFDGKTESETAVPRRGREVACAVQMANQAILARAHGDEDLTGMGTTLVAARFSPNKQRVYIGHVGDSRCYRLRGKSMRQLTTDHTLLGLGLTGPGSQSLYQAVGIKPRITIDVIIDKPRADDIYLLCTDGLCKMASDDRIRDILLAESDLEAASYCLIELANDRGGKDNITVILVKVLERVSQLT